MSTGLRAARLYGGPLDGQEGECVAMPLPDHLEMGAQGGFIYRLAGLKDGRVVFRYDALATRDRLLDLGIHPSLAAQALDTRSQVPGLLARGATVEPPVDGAQYDVAVERHAGRWDLYVNGTLVETQPRGAFADDDTEALKQWTEEVVHALAQEAMK